MGGPNIVDTASLLTATETHTISGQGAHTKAVYLIDVTAITRTTGNATVAAYWSPDGTVAGGVKLGESGSLTSVSHPKRIIPTAPYDQEEVAVPEPNLIVWTLNGDTTNLSGNVYAVYGDQES